MIYIKVWEIVKWIFSMFPIEQLVAKLLTKAIQKVSSKDDLAKLAKTVQHISESVNIAAGIVQDAEVTEDEVNLVGTKAAKVGADLIRKWADGEPAKELEQILADMEAYGNK